MRKLRLFLSFPGDVDAERQKVPSIVAQLNRMLGTVYDVHVEVVEWRTHVAPDMGRPQAVINRQIGEYDIFVGIMWKRFGTPTGKADSGTEEEFNIAYENWRRFKKPRILFYFSQVPYTPRSSVEIVQWGKVIVFKEKLEKKGLIVTYDSPEEFADLLREHLGAVLNEWFSAKGKPPAVGDFTKYLNDLKTETMHIDIRGLVTGEPKARNFRIDQLYIPLKTTAAGLSDEKRGKKTKARAEDLVPREVPLHEALSERRLLIKGDPGSGKTTFLRLIAFTLCQKALGDESRLGSTGLVWPDPPPLPVFVRLGRLTEHIRESKARKEEKKPMHDDNPEWLLHFLDAESREFNWKLTAEHFHAELESGHCLILLDGLDEAPDVQSREKVSALAAHLLKAYPQNQVVLTSRPAALVGKVVPTDFSIAEIAPLDNAATEVFLAQWSAALHPGSPEKSQAHRKELQEALQARAEIRRMARTPVMLTALAVVHWNETRLPEQRAELYESIITWLLRAREQRTGRLKADRCRKLLQKLALAMFTHAQGRQRQTGLRWAAEMLAEEFTRSEECTPIESASYFLNDEMVDSGIIVGRANRMEFWHLSFQEYLAAYEIAGMLEKDQQKLLFKGDRIYSTEWRELVLLLGGILYKQGEDKINHLIDGIIAKCPTQVVHKTLPQLAKNVGIMGGTVQDLSPFEFAPSNSRYDECVQGVMGIFDKASFRRIPVQVRIEAADVLGQVGDPRLEAAPMVPIEGGSFWMGAQKRDRKGRNYDPDAWEEEYNESPVHEVQLSPFVISKYPITVGQYRRFFDEGGYEEEAFWRTGGFGEFKEPGEWQDQLQYPSRPVVSVSWYEASAYAHWVGGRLPTEAEWERAARGPGKYRKYPWGNTEPDKETANYVKTGVGHVTPVGVFPLSCSPEGAIDMAGNVWEWCWDWFSKDYYRECSRQGVARDPRGPEKGDYRVVRGGSFPDDPSRLRCAYRLRDNPQVRGVNLGFRVVRAV